MLTRLEVPRFPTISVRSAPKAFRASRRVAVRRTKMARLPPAKQTAACEAVIASGRTSSEAAQKRRVPIIMPWVKHTGSLGTFKVSVCQV